MSNLLEFQLLEQRRDLVRSYLGQGLTINEMIARLEKAEMKWFPPTYTYQQKHILLKKDVKYILDANRKLYVVDKKDADLAMVEYLDRQQYLYKNAVSDGEWRLAADISKDIARAKGVPVDEVVQVKTDIGAFLKAGFAAQQQRKALPSPVNAIDVTPTKPDPRLAEIQKIRRKDEKAAIVNLNGESS